MPFVRNDGVRIHYEIEGSGPPLLLVHGKTSSLASWRDLGYVDALSAEYQLLWSMHAVMERATSRTTQLHTRCNSTSRISW